jgi:hypothetical protein
MATKAEIRKERAFSKARIRGNIAAEWFKNNKLTQDNLPEFRKLMKKANAEFDREK